MLEYEVANRAELIAAVNAAAQPTYAEARLNPVRITWGRCRYSFPGGLQADRAERLLRNIRRTVPARSRP